MPIDQRFFRHGDPVSLQQICDLTGAGVQPADLDKTVTSVASLSSAQIGDVTFFESEKGETNISSDATACFVRDSDVERLPQNVAPLVCDNPRYAHAGFCNSLISPKHSDANWNASLIDPSAKVGKASKVTPNVVIGADAAIGENSVIGPGTVIGPGVQIGRDCEIGANVSIFCALIGNNVSISSGARIGEAGFGVIPGPDGAIDAPQLGRVILQDHVSIGANSCVDRGAFDDTILGERTKIDNLCQIAHNVQFGRGVLMAAFGGISGSVTVGDGSMLGGRVGIADHVNVGKGVSLAASAGLFRNIEDGETWGGTPAKPIRQWMRETAWLQKQANPKRKPKSDA